MVVRWELGLVYLAMFATACSPRQERLPEDPRDPADIRDARDGEERPA